MKTFKQFLIEKYQEKHDHSSAQVLLPKNLAMKILDWGDNKVPDDIVYNDPDNPAFGREDEPHVTILHGLFESDPENIKELVQNFKSFNVKLGKMSLFTSNEKFDVLKIDVHSEGLNGLNSKLKNNLETTRQYPQYVPHITIAYVNKKSSDEFVGNKVFEGQQFHVDEIVFSSKNGEKTKIRISNEK